MNFFKAVFADDEPDSESEPLSSEPNDDDHSNHDDSGSDSEPDPKSPSDPKQSNPNSSEPTLISTSAWNFGGLIKTLATKSESVIDTYKRDLQEFSTGLKAETAVFREVANRAVKELPEAGVSTFDELKTTVLKGTTQIISQGKEVLLSLDQEISTAADKSGNERSFCYNRFDARLRAIQIDKETYCLQPDDLEDYKKWKLGFVLEEKGDEIGKLFEENAAMENIYHKIVPSEIDPETFWYRYFYKELKLKQAEEVRASFLKKAIDDEDEELSWDVDEDDEEEDTDGGKVGESVAVSRKEKKSDKNESVKESSIVEVNKDLISDGEVPQGSLKVDDNAVKRESQDADSGKLEVDDKVDETRNVTESKKEKGKAEDTLMSNESKHAPKSEKEVDVKNEDSATKPEPGTTTDEDLEWDEIEDEDDDKPATPRKSHDNAELQKRLSTSVDDEDLSWDIEDDDEPVHK